MKSKLCKWLVVVCLIPTWCLANQIAVKSSAPEVYIVKKGDTLWDIAGMYLQQPWQWPELWRTNVHLENPHLIYPGDELRFAVNHQGQPVLQVVRNSPQKQQITLSPQGRLTNKVQPISLLPWSVIAPYLKRDRIMLEEEYNAQPYLLGNKEAALRFAKGDVVLSRAVHTDEQEYQVVRKQNKVLDQAGNVLGYQVRHVADAKRLPGDFDTQILVQVGQSNFEAKRGDKLMPVEDFPQQAMPLLAAGTQRGHIVDNLEQRTLLGKFDVAVVDLGQAQVRPGTVMGIYQQGPDILVGEEPKYAGESNPLKSVFASDGEIQQPAMKVGELVIFKVFDQASYGLITGSTDIIRAGAIVAAP